MMGVGFMCVIGTTSYLQGQESEDADAVVELVARLNLESYKNTLKG